MKAEAGKLKHRATVYGKAKSVNDQGKTVYEDGIIKTLQCEIIPQTGNMMRSQAETMLTQCTHKVVCRYHSGKSITKDMHLVYNGRRFGIIYILNPYFSNEQLEIFCKEVMT